MRALRGKKRGTVGKPLTPHCRKALSSWGILRASMHALASEKITAVQ